MICENCNRRAGQLEQTPAGSRCLCKQCRDGHRANFTSRWAGRRSRREVLSARKWHRRGARV